jgi:signal transduction histidine kinase
MKRFGWRGLIQLFAVTILPLTVLLLLVTFGSVAWHERDMRALVGERDERAVQSAAAALESELHHRAVIVSMLADGDSANADLRSDFDGGIAYFNSAGLIQTATPSPLWDSISPNDLASASASSPDIFFSAPLIDPASKKFFVVVSVYSPSRKMIVAGAFTPASLASEVFSSTYPAHSHATIFLMDSSRRLLYVSGALAPESLPADHPGVAEALRGESGAQYVVMSDAEHVVAYSPITTTGWAVITEEEWGHVVSPSLQATQMAPLVFIPIFLLALIALWFGAKQIVQPLQKLEAKAAALAAGDFDAIKESVGGISEVQRLQKELTEMSRKVQAAQMGLHDYIGAITAAQEDERLRLAHELHDETIQAVIALKQRIQLAEKSVKDKRGKQTLQELENLAEQTVENLRRIIRALRPIYLEDLGLVTALEMLARETKSLRVDFRRAGHEQRLERHVELALYRIAQEALGNVARHAQANSAALELHFSARDIQLTISDDGVGFVMPASPTDFASSGHFGLLGMKERAEALGGKFEVKSQAGSGTRVAVWIPIMNYEL